MTLYLKDPAASVDYRIDWGDRLGGRSVSSAAWSVSPVEDAGVTVSSSAIEGAATRATLSGGVPGHVYRVASHVTLSDGRSDTRSLTLRVEAA